MGQILDKYSKKQMLDIKFQNQYTQQQKFDPCDKEQSQKKEDFSQFQLNMINQRDQHEQQNISMNPYLRYLNPFLSNYMNKQNNQNIQNRQERQNKQINLKQNKRKNRLYMHNSHNSYNPYIPYNQYNQHNSFVPQLSVVKPQMQNYQHVGELQNDQGQITLSLYRSLSGITPNYYHYFIQPLDINKPNIKLEIDFPNIDRKGMNYPSNIQLTRAYPGNYTLIRPFISDTANQLYVDNV